LTRPSTGYNHQKTPPPLGNIDTRCKLEKTTHRRSNTSTQQGPDNTQTPEPADPTQPAPNKCTDAFHAREAGRRWRELTVGVEKS